MKKWIVIILAVILLWNVFGGSSNAAEDACNDLAYEIYSYHWENGKFYMNGNICNTSSVNDVLGLEDATLTITDSKGLELFTVNVNSSLQKGLRLRPQSKAPYNITAQNLKYNINDYSSLTSGLQVFLNCNYFYSECDGRHCERCHYTGLGLMDDSFAEGGYSNNDLDDTFTMKCYKCNGGGKCQDCGGSGKSKLKGVLGSGGCALCEASGRCYKCNGKGYTVHH